MEKREDNFMYAHLSSKRRRVRVREGATWVPDTTLIEYRDTGLLCKNCHKRIKWKELDCVYEMQGTDIMRMWVCTWCDNVIQTDNMDEIALRMEMEQDYVIIAKGGSPPET